MEGWRKFLKEDIQPEVGQEQDQSQGSWPSDPPKNVKIEKGSDFSSEQIQKLWNSFSTMNPPKDPDQVLQIIGGIDVMTKNIKELAGHFANADENPDRIAMPVVDPDKDFPDLRQGLSKGQLDFKEPFAPDEDKFPQGLDKVDPKIQSKFLTKGLRDGDPKDDAGVTLTPKPISCGSSYPTQKQVYLDKCIWNILNFGPTKPGGTAHGKPNLIAIQASPDKNLILDGHHRWAAAFISGGSTAQINVQVLSGLDAPTAIAALRSFGNAKGNAQKA